MTTTQIITFIKNNFAPDWSRTKILDLLNIVQHMLCDHDCEQMLFTCDNGDFPAPYLLTTSGTIEYQIVDANLSHPITWKGMPTTCRRVKDIFVKIEGPLNYDYGRRYRRESFRYSVPNPWYMLGANRITFERVPARMIDGNELQAAKIIFPENPQTHTDKYLIEFWVNPIELSSESIQMSLNASEFFDVILDGVVGMIEQAEHGESRRWERFMAEGRKRFWSNINKGNENMPLQIQRVVC